MNLDQKTVLKKYFAGQCTDEEKQFVEDFLLSEENPSLSNYLESEWNDTTPTLPQDTKQARRRFHNIQKIIGKPERSQKVWLAAAASVLILLLPLSYLLLKNSCDDIAWQTIETSVGQRKNIELPDGTNVWLNCASSLSYPKAFEGNTRLVKIEGEAFFKVTKNKEKPFIVAFNNHYTKVLGTSFNIKAYPNTDWEYVSVIEGKVAVGKSSQHTQQQYTVLVANERAALSTHSDQFLKSVNQDTKSEVTWRSGALRFQQTSLSDVLAELQRRYNAKLILKQDKNTAMPSFTASIRPDTSLDEVLKILSMTEKITYEKKDDKYIISPK